MNIIEKRNVTYYKLRKVLPKQIAYKLVCMFI